MTVLRERMLADMQLRGLAEKTQEAYLRAVRQLAEYYGKSPDQIDEEELRQYFLYLKNEKKASRSSCTIAICSLKFFYKRNLAYHPHVHFLVPAGGVDGNGRWRSARHNFLVPVRALSVLFRAKFRDVLQQTPFFDQIAPAVWRQPWVVYCKPIGDGRTALRYLAPFIFRVAISNRRILKLAKGKVSFRYFTSETGKPRICTLTAAEFIRRFLQHVLPKGFVKVRYYGFFAPGLCSRLLAIRQQLPAPSPTTVTQLDPETLKPERSLLCPRCGLPMTHRQRIWPRSRWPPAA